MPLQNSKPSLYALLVGIDKYETPVPPLNGCVNDLNKVVKYLEKETDHFNVKIKSLINEDATKDNIVSRFREHLGKAGDGDTAFFLLFRAWNAGGGGSHILVYRRRQKT